MTKLATEKETTDLRVKSSNLGCVGKKKRPSLTKIKILSALPSRVPTSSLRFRIPKRAQQESREKSRAILMHTYVPLMTHFNSLGREADSSIVQWLECGQCCPLTQTFGYWRENDTIEDPL